MKTPKFITQADYEKAVLQNIERSKAIEELNKLILAKMEPAYEAMSGALQPKGENSHLKTDAYIFRAPFVECDHIVTKHAHRKSIREEIKVKVIKGFCEECQEIVD